MKLLIKVLLFVIQVLNTWYNKLDNNKQYIQSVNRQDLELITKNFPPFIYKKGMTQEEIAHETVKCWGEQRVIQYITSRIQGRVGQGVTYG